uniref:Neuritin 1a n=1 Tax=Sinocyclocheilus anshuiensis TaxID=1608454 RepID=A0A671M4Q4_9TELE
MYKTDVDFLNKIRYLSVYLMLFIYWDDFHSCATTALADCQEGATDLWEKLKKESRNLDFRGSLFELCAAGNGASRSSVPFGVTLILPALSALVTWMQF